MNETKKAMNQTIVRNKKTGYEHSIFHKGEFPAISTIKKHLRLSKNTNGEDRTVFINSIDNQGKATFLKLKNGKIKTC